MHLMFTVRPIISKLFMELDTWYINNTFMNWAIKDHHCFGIVEEYTSCIEGAGCSRKSLHKQLSATVKVKGKR